MIILSGTTQLEFIAEDEIVDIVPNLKMGPLNFICVSKNSNTQNWFYFADLYTLHFLFTNNDREILAHLRLRLLLKYRCGWPLLSRREASAPFGLPSGCP